LVLFFFFVAVSWFCFAFFSSLFERLPHGVQGRFTNNGIQKKKKEFIRVEGLSMCMYVYAENIYGSMSDLLQLVPLHLIVSQMQKRGQQNTIKNIERIDSK